MIRKASFAEVEYPDRKPMAETPIHRVAMTDLIARLEHLFADRGDVYVGANMFVYYVQGDPEYNLSPDVYVAFGVDKPQRRDTFKTWAEGSMPSVVFEITLKSTQKEDFDTKFKIYQGEWKVKEYFLFDPMEEYLEPSLQGYRRNRLGELRASKPVRGELTSQALGITLSRRGTKLILRDAKSGKELLTESEAATERERARAETAESEVARLLAELAKRDKSHGD